MSNIDLTGSQLAEILQRGRSSITSMIESGRLSAYDAAPDGKKRQWRVTSESLDRFREQNAAKPKPKRSRKLPAVVRQYV
ncbi:MAG: helix-turn-helix domain-containing protein [Fuerstiella sp.]